MLEMSVQQAELKSVLMKSSKNLILIGLVLSIGQFANALAEVKKSVFASDPQTGQSFEVPYLLTQTNHFVVRAIINGKGPFHLVVDTGAPGLFLGTEASKKVGIKSEKGKFFSNLEELRLEGGPVLKNLPMRVEDPFQLTGMNSLGLPGIKLDGLMGFSVLARYRITLDPTQKSMIWTRLDFNPKQTLDDIPVARREEMPAELQAMNLLGPAMKFASIFIGRQPDMKRLPQGFAGFTIQDGNVNGPIIVGRILSDSPAAKADLKPGDELIQVEGKRLKNREDLARILEQKAAGSQLELSIRRSGENKSIQLKLSEAF
jgi:membrane-associated protease RseP (regulator of RpoE activity)